LSILASPLLSWASEITKDPLTPLERVERAKIGRMVVQIF